MAILFDLDGVLIDSLELHRRVWHEWADRHGLDPDVVFEATFGRRAVDTIREVAARLVPADELRALNLLLDANVDAVELQPGASGAIEIASNGAWAVVTSAERRRVAEHLSRLGCPVPDVVIGAEDVSAGKPAPDGYLAAAARLAVTPSDCLVVEDAPSGIDAARAAGMTVVGVATTRPAAELTHADVVVTDMVGAQAVLRDWVDRRGGRDRSAC